MKMTATMSGTVNQDNYNALIQAAGRLPGVTLRGFTAQASSGTHAELQTRLRHAEASPPQCSSSWRWITV